MRIAIVVARFNDFVTERLLSGARDALTDAGIGAESIDVHHVPGAFEIPLAGEGAAARGDVDGVVCLGCLIKGATPHFEYISSACAHAIMAAQSATAAQAVRRAIRPSGSDRRSEPRGPPRNRRRQHRRPAIRRIGLTEGLLDDSGAGSQDYFLGR